MLTELLGAGKLISGVLEKVIPDPNAKAEAEKTNYGDYGG